MSAENKVPAIRFKGFSEGWKEKKLGQVVDFLDEQRRPIEAGKREAGQFPYYGASGIVDYVKGYIFDEELILLSEDGANILDRNYRICFLARGKYWVNNHAHVLKGREKYSNSFICEALERLNYEKYNTGTAQPKINQEVCRNISLVIPNQSEQTKIGNYFQQLDTLIAQHQQKHDKLLNLKKALLEKMFPKQGATVPEIRFKGFYQDWNKKKLHEVCQEFQSGKFIKAEAINIDGAYPVYGGNGLRGYTTSYNYDGTYALIGRQGALCGNMNIFTGKAYFTEHAIAVRANDYGSTYFLFYLLGIMKLGQYSGQSAQPGLAVNKLTELTAYFSCPKEQTKIGNLFKQLDTLITQHQTQLKKLNNTKQACLEKMFV